MFLILISYVFILYIIFGMGLIFNKWINLENYNIVFTVFIGMFVQLIISTFYAVFFPLDQYFFLINLTLSTLFITFNFQTVKKSFQQVLYNFTLFSRNSKILLLTTVVLSLLHSSSLPFLTDNETYYIQTIKWLNNYGLVNGVANLHPFLGQFSGWHILQASFNFSFLTDNLNDINGFLIIVSSYFMIEKWEKYKLIGNKNDLFISLIFIVLVGLFFFIGSPSTDFPILIIVPIIVYLYLDLYQNNKIENIILITILCLLITSIKVTISPILLLLIVVLAKGNDSKFWKITAVMSLISLSGFVIKNIIITGHPLYPIALGNELVKVNWKINNNIQYNWEEFNKLNFIDKFWAWINLPKINGILNKLILFFMFVFPFFIRKKKEMYFLYAYFLVQFIIFYITSSQYRFFMPILLAMSLLIASKLLHKKFTAIKLLVITNLTILFIIGIFGLNTDKFTNSDIMSKKYALIPSQIILPRAITQFENLEYAEYQLENLNYFSPSKDSIFFWQTSDGPIPCMNKDMIDYFSKHYDHIPQMRTSNIKDGFLSAIPKH
ncbi:hypothetical protein UMM65_06105 [Aureibaculum sp. 2210JD6-5]|uniref:LIC_10190 family membrane protein n=1 Tax=Aureibaculum sp. 2210JD6-5 TaxID=3103957 RepID=UPI002AADFC09|nr:hypothetical protein [Aureibaculum sp. 2210JD6-5]MDY7394806.1 hypothetical protein [Aureibaculum sp. 2210JD6-5]